MLLRSSIRHSLTRTTTTTAHRSSHRTLFGFSWFTGKKNKTEIPTPNTGSGESRKSVDQKLGSSTSHSVPTSSPQASSGSSSFRATTLDPNPSPSPSPSTSLPTSTPAASHPTPTQTTEPKDPTTPTKQPTTEEQERAAIRALLDRDGGALGFGYEDGKPEGGQRRDVKREMFRVI